MNELSHGQPTPGGWMTQTKANAPRDILGEALARARALVANGMTSISLDIHVWNNPVTLGSPAGEKVVSVTLKAEEIIS